MDGKNKWTVVAVNGWEIGKTYDFAFIYQRGRPQQSTIRRRELLGNLAVNMAGHTK